MAILSSFDLIRRFSKHPDESVVPSGSTIVTVGAELDPEPQIPWLETFHLRSGVDALTGQPKASALKRPTTGEKSSPSPNDGSARAHTAVKAIRGVHQQSREHKFEGGGTVNSSQLALNASFAMQTSQFSSDHSFLVETVVSGEYDFEKLDLEDLELTPEALALSKKHQEFRKIHGDYFVLGSKRRYWFHALVECRSSGVDDNQSIETSATISWQNLLGIHGQVENNRGDFKFDLNATAWVSHSGCRFPTSTAGAPEPPAGLWVTCKDVIQMAKTIQTTEQPGWKEKALLVPYSRVLSTLPNTVPVPRGVFDMLHNLEAIAISVHYDCLHPAFERYGNIASEAKAAVEHFRSHRASFITNDTALEDARRSLEDATAKVRSLLARYRFLEELVKEWRGRPPIGEKFEEEAADQKWQHGVVSTDLRDTRNVSLTDGTVAFQGRIEGEIRNILPFSHNYLRFECREGQSVSPHQEPSTLIVGRRPCYIVGWTLSIRTKRPGSKSFSVKTGGILESRLTVEIKAPTFHQAEWRCRIYFVDRADYNFPHLLSK